MSAPILTLPEKEADLLKQVYSRATSILEYGSGGSTLIAAQTPGCRALSVESDPNWAKYVAAHVEKAGAADRVKVRHADIGPTRRWGAPTSRAHSHLFHTYPLAVWSDPDFTHPDVVLVDGRFRPACFVTTAMLIERPVTLLFDDYDTRPQYAHVERLVKPVEIVGRMARFELEPAPVPKKHLPWIIATYSDPDYARPRGHVRLFRRLMGKPERP
ncbi:hypothetical protein [Amaricoccus tamworthensis]|uniref:hypothetical protein n=1 Tax=Amaricoccus tamworthensis TaxID=57002 RepID=UPI003C7E6896